MNGHKGTDIKKIYIFHLNYEKSTRAKMETCPSQPKPTAEPTVSLTL